KLAKLVPPEGTKETHKAVRDLCKTCTLGLNYGMSAFGLGQRLGLPTAYATELITAHQRAYPRFWKWQQNVVDKGLLSHTLHSLLEWQLYVGPQTHVGGVEPFSPPGESQSTAYLGF